jgi:hypothetical protein
VLLAQNRRARFALFAGGDLPMMRKSVSAPLSFVSAATMAAMSLAIFALTSCGGGATTTSAATTTPTVNAYAAAYAKMTWAPGVTISFPSSCSMTVSGSGLPYQHAAFYLTPVISGGTIVATTASGIQLGVSPYAGSGLSTSVKAVSATFNICPTRATSTTTRQPAP